VPTTTLGVSAAPTTPSGLADSAILNGYVNNVRDTASQALTGVADAGVTITVYDGATLLGTATADGGGAWSYTLGRLADGAHKLTAIATDAGGLVSAPSAPLTFKVDTRPPSKPGGLADSSIAQGFVNAAHNTADQALTGKTDAGAAIAIFDGATQIGTATADPTGAWSFTLGQLAEGGHKLSATATDAAGNTSAASDLLSFTVDTAAPGAPSGLADGKIVGGYVNAAHDLANQALTGKAQAYAFVSVYDGATKLGVVQASGTGDWSFTLGKLADGDHSLSATAADKAGNTGSASAHLDFTVDTHAPAVSPGQASVDPDSGAFRLSGVSEAGAAITISTGATKRAAVIADVDGHWSTTLSGADHVFTVSATDAAGNKAAAPATFYNALAVMQGGLTAALDGAPKPSATLVNLPASLPDGVTYDPATHSFTLDPGAAAYQALGAGESVTVSVDYGVVDGATTTAAEVAWTVTGLTVEFVDGDLTLTGADTAAGETLSIQRSGATLVGDVRGLSDQTLGGNDDLTVRGSGPLQTIGDALFISDQARGGDDKVYTLSDGVATSVGDALRLSGDAVGGNDNVKALGMQLGVAIGDAITITDHARGGDDLVAAGPLSRYGGGVAYGDAQTMSGYATGGNDTVSAHIAYGDAETLTDYAQGGDDAVKGSFALPYLYDAVLFGDGAVLSGHASGGDDTVTGSTAYGDAKTLTDDAQGGDDLVQGSFTAQEPFGANRLYGDGAELSGHAHGGADTVIGGAGSNLMWGDAASVAATATTGADLFVFQANNRHDQIMDFQVGKDRIEVDGFGFTGFADLSSHFQTTAGGILISFDADNNVLVRGVTVGQLTASDFVFG
jgi:hypothetical protein